MTPPKPPNCLKCKLYEKSVLATRNEAITLYKLSGVGNSKAKIMFIGDSVRTQDVISTTPFGGNVGHFLLDVLEKSGIKKEDCYFTTLVKCHCPEKKQALKKEARLCLSFLQEEIESVSPTLLVLFGALPLEIIGGITGIQKARGKSLKVKIGEKEYNAIATYHPSHVLGFPEYKYLKDDFEKDICTIKRLSESPNDIEKKTEVNYKIYTEDNQVHDVWAYLDEVIKEKICSYDLETTGLDFWKDEIISFGISKKDHEGIAFTKNLFDKCFDKIKFILESREILKIGQNMKFDNLFLRAKGIDVKLPIFDTMLAHYLVDENSPHDLKDMAWRFTDMGGYADEIEAKSFHLWETFTKEQREKILLYNIADVDCTIRLYPILLKKLIEENVQGVFHKILLPMSQVFTDTEYFGIPLDKDYLEKLSLNLNDSISDIEFRLNSFPEVLKVEKSINEGIEKDSKKYSKFNFGSTPHLRKLLYDELKLPPLKKTKTGFSADSESLEALQGKHEIIDLILKYRGLEYDRSHYIEQMRENVDNKGRIHTNFKLHSAVSGRPQSSSPNLQNIPKKSHIKRLFRAEENCLLLSADYRQIEFRIWLDLAKDYQVLERIKSGMDIHSDICCLTWPHLYEKLGEGQYKFKETGIVARKIDGHDGTKASEHRTSAKGGVYGLMYGRGAKAIAMAYNISEGEAIKIKSAFFSISPLANAWLENQKKFVRKHKHVLNAFGRKRRLPEIDSRDEAIVSTIERQACNIPIQGTGTDILSTGTIRTYNTLKKEGMKSRLVLAVHDANKYNVPIEELEKAKNIIEKGMREPIKGINFDLDVDFEIGPSWGDMISWEEFNVNRGKYLDIWGLTKQSVKG